jgi:nucleoside phosphorylase
MKKLIITALHAEAKPLLSFFKLKKDSLSTKVPIYRNETITLAVSGVGKIKSAIATTYLLSREKEPQKIVAFNIGICGSGDRRTKIGKMFFVHKIVDNSSGKNYYPDIFLKHNLPEATLTTFDKPVVNQASFDKTFEGLADMEAAGFFESALTFLPPHQIACLKVVSDFLQGERLEKSQVSQLIEQNLEAIESIVSNYDVLEFFQTRVLEDEDYTLLEQLRAHLRLTVTQYHQLIDWIKSYRIRKKGSLEALKQFLQYPVSTKRERNYYLELLRSILMDE